MRLVGRPKSTFQRRKPGRELLLDSNTNVKGKLNEEPPSSMNMPFLNKSISAKDADRNGNDPTRGDTRPPTPLKRKGSIRRLFPGRSKEAELPTTTTNNVPLKSKTEIDRAVAMQLHLLKQQKIGEVNNINSYNHINKKKIRGSTAEGQIQSKGTEAFVEALSLNADSVEDIKYALKQMEEHLTSAMIEGKRISRHKVKDALMQVVDTLDYDDESMSASYDASTLSTGTGGLTFERLPKKHKYPIIITASYDSEETVTVSDSKSKGKGQNDPCHVSEGGSSKSDKENRESFLFSAGKGMMCRSNLAGVSDKTTKPEHYFSTNNDFACSGGEMGGFNKNFKNFPGLDSEDNRPAPTYITREDVICVSDEKNVVQSSSETTDVQRNWSFLSEEEDTLRTDEVDTYEGSFMGSTIVTEESSSTPNKSKLEDVLQRCKAQHLHMNVASSVASARKKCTDLSIAKWFTEGRKAETAVKSKGTKNAKKTKPSDSNCQKLAFSWFKMSEEEIAQMQRAFDDILWRDPTPAKPLNAKSKEATRPVDKSATSTASNASKSKKEGSLDLDLGFGLGLTGSDLFRNISCFDQSHKVRRKKSKARASRPKEEIHYVTKTESIKSYPNESEVNASVQTDSVFFDLLSTYEEEEETRKPKPTSALKGWRSAALADDFQSIVI